MKIQWVWTWTDHYICLQIFNLFYLPQLLRTFEVLVYSSLVPFILLGCVVCRVKYKELMPELLTANYSAPVSPLPSPRQADVELMQGRVSLPLHYKQPPFQSKYFTIFNTSPAGRVEKLLIWQCQSCLF